jgi:hypothetical protein
LYIAKKNDVLNLEKIAQELASQIIFEQSQNPEIPKLRAELTDPPTARKVYHSVLKTEILYSIIPDIETYNYTSWDAGTNYLIGDTVERNGFKYVSLTGTTGAPNTGNDPVTSPAEWIELFSKTLIDWRKASIKRFVSAVVNSKKINQETKQLLDDLILYSGTGYHGDTIIKKGRLVGFEIQLLNNNNISVLLDKIGLQFTDAQTVMFYLYNSEFSSVYKTIEVVYSNAGNMQFATLQDINGDPVELLYKDLENNIAGGTWYLLYDEDQITGQAINKRLNIGSRPCVSCSNRRHDRQAFDQYSQYFKILAVSVDANSRPSSVNEMFDYRRATYHTNSNFGLNMRVSGQCDLTDPIIDNKNVFSEGINSQIIVDLLQEVATNTRSSVISEKVRDFARIALQPENLGGEGALRKLEKNIEAASFELSDIQSSVCMPPQKSKGVKITSVKTGSRHGGSKYYY